MMPCTHSRHSVPEAAQQPQNITEPPPCLTVGKVFFSLKASFCFLSTWRWCALSKSSNLDSSIHRTFSQKDFGLFRCVLANFSRAFFRLFLSSGVLLCLSLECPFIELVTDGASWNCRTLCLKVSLNLFGSWSRCFLHHSNTPLQSDEVLSCGHVQGGWLQCHGP